MTEVEQVASVVARHLERMCRLNEDLVNGHIRARVPAVLAEMQRPLEDVIAAAFPTSHAALKAAQNGLFYSLPVAFDPAESVGCYLATVDRAPDGQAYRFIDMGALIATQAFGENDMAIVAAIVEGLPYAVGRYAHSEYQTHLSLRLKAALDGIAPQGTPRHFVVNTGAEAVENAIKAVLLNRVRLSGDRDGGVIISFEGAFHGRTLGALAVTHRKKARMGFPTFEWPQVLYPTEDLADPEATTRREAKALRHIWQLMVSGRKPVGPVDLERFEHELARIDAILDGPRSECVSRLSAERAACAPEATRKAKRVAAVLVEPIQGEGGVWTASARFFRRLRTLTALYDVPLIFDEVQTGFGATGRLWAHEHFDLPLPPDAVTWAKKAQNGVLFVSEDLATFFQEEKKFNTTWEGDSVGMLRLLAMLDRLDLEAVTRTGAHARAALESVARDFDGLIDRVRGQGVMLAFSVSRADWRDVLRDRAFRRGLLLLPTGERSLRFYPRYNTSQATIDEAIELLRAAIRDTLAADAYAPVGPGLRMGTFEVPAAHVQWVEVDAQRFATLAAEIMAVEIGRYGLLAQYPANVMRAGTRPLLQYPVEVLRATAENARSLGLVARDAVSGRIVAYALGSPLENHNEKGVRDDPRFGESDTFYLQALATLPSVRNSEEIENLLLDTLLQKVGESGFAYLSALIEARIVTSGPLWCRNAKVLRRVGSYLRSGIPFVYLQAPIAP